MMEGYSINSFIEAISLCSTEACSGNEEYSALLIKMLQLLPRIWPYVRGTYALTTRDLHLC